jgi:hypothetical protein
MTRSPELKPAFRAVLHLVAKASKRMKAAGAAEPIIVGGAAVEVYTAGAIVSGDIDVAVPNQELFEDELLKLGFVRDTRSGSHRGLYHPVYGYGLEVVARTPMDGKPQRDSYARYRTSSGDVLIISLEDLIADRIAQFDATPRGDRSRLLQAVSLYAGAKTIDKTYLAKRISEEAHGRTLAWFIKEVEKTARQRHKRKGIRDR